jgi:hypothetical protein
MEFYKCDINSPYVFISYARVNRDKVRADMSGLQEYGCNAWLDEENMVGGKPVEQTDGIIRNPNCKALIFYMCELSVCSPYCLAELRAAKKYNIPIIPVHCFPVSGLEETIIKLQRFMENSEQVEVSDCLISEILKTKNGSEMISIPYDTPAHIIEIVKSFEGNNAGSVINPKPKPAAVHVPEPELISTPEPEPASKKKNKKPLIFAVAGALSIALITGIVIFFTGTENPQYIAPVANESIVGVWICESGCTADWHCELFFLANGDFIDNDGDTGTFTIHGESLILNFDNWDTMFIRIISLTEDDLKIQLYSDDIYHLSRRSLISDYGSDLQNITAPALIPIFNRD